MPAQMLTSGERSASQPLPEGADGPLIEEEALRIARRRHRGRVRRLKLNVAAWAVGTAAVTTLWVAAEWNANGWFQRFGHEGQDGQWNPTLWALAVGVWSVIVGIMALRVHFERPETDLHTGRLKFHVASWVLGVALLTPLWALIEWQDNGSFERLGNDSQPGEWEPWILYVAGAWGLGVAVIALRMYMDRRPRRGADVPGRRPHLG